MIVARPLARDQRREPGGVAGKTRQRVGVHHDRARRRTRLGQGGGGERAGFLADAGARADQDGVATRIGEQRRKAGEAVEGRDHHRRRMGGVDGDRVERARQRDEPCPDPERRARRKAACAGAMARPCESQHGAARIFVRGGARPRQSGEPDRRRIQIRARRDGGERAWRAADVGQHKAAAQKPAGKQEMAGLEAEKGDARARLHRRAAHFARLAVEAGGHIDAEDGLAGAREGVDRLDARKRDTVDVARQARAEDRVDHEIRIGESECLRARDILIVARRRQRGVAAQISFFTEQSEAHAIAARGKQAAGDEAVAAVTARPAENRDSARLGAIRTASSATAAPARSISVMPATPAAIVKRSLSAISAGVKSSGFLRGSSMTRWWRQGPLVARE